MTALDIRHTYTAFRYLSIVSYFGMLLVMLQVMCSLIGIIIGIRAVMEACGLPLAAGSSTSSDSGGQDARSGARRGGCRCTRFLLCRLRRSRRRWLRRRAALELLCSGVALGMWALRERQDRRRRQRLDGRWFGHRPGDGRRGGRGARGLHGGCGCHCRSGGMRTVPITAIMSILTFGGGAGCR